MSKLSAPPRPIWLTALGVISLAAIGAALVYAVSIGFVNLSRIGV